MSKRAEKRALELFPVDMQMCIDNMEEPYEADVNAPRRMYVAYGYEQAEKDLALTWEDMANIDAIILDVNNEFAVDYSKEISRQKFYEEVLRRLNEQRKK